jgi:hypothetical protein
VKGEDDVCALMLEVIRNHDCRQSRFLRGATIDASKRQDAHGAEATVDASRALLALRAGVRCFREVTWRDFEAWFDRMRQAVKAIDAHQAFEEIRLGLAAQGRRGALARAGR